MSLSSGIVIVSFIDTDGCCVSDTPFAQINLNMSNILTWWGSNETPVYLCRTVHGRFFRWSSQDNVAILLSTVEARELAVRSNVNPQKYLDWFDLAEV